ncbi:MAG: hypothetical protein EXS55_03020 [Candidatus Magasanikbacteria bacterium]|nr:hypothetical protein [Candidatus Magasanikbacteria bacterium]
MTTEEAETPPQSDEEFLEELRRDVDSADEKIAAFKARQLLGEDIDKNKLSDLVEQRLDFLSILEGVDDRIENKKRLNFKRSGESE